MNLYQKLRTKHQKEINEFPVKFAFNMEQFKKSMEELGLTENDTDKVVRVGTNGFCKKADAPKLAEMLQKHSSDMEALIAADKTGDGFIFDMFYYELCNHEYGYVYDVAIEEVLEALGFTKEQIEADEKLKNGFEKAKFACINRENL